MLSKPNNMSRRGFLRNILGVTAAIILPAKPVWPHTFASATVLPPYDGIRGLRVSATIYDEVQDLDMNMLPIKFDRFVYPRFRSTQPGKVVVIRKARADTKSYWPPTLPVRQGRYRGDPRYRVQV